VVTLGAPALLVLQFCAKGALEDLLIAQPEVAEPELLHFCVGIAAGMQYLASRAFVHRDLASRNVVVDSGNTPKVSDFGLSKKLGSAVYYRSRYAGLQDVCSAHRTNYATDWFRDWAGQRNVDQFASGLVGATVRPCDTRATTILCPPPC